MPRYQLIMRTPPKLYGQLWKEAMPLGNGFTGAMLFGSVCEETLLVNRCDLWSGGKTEGFPDVHETLEKVRAYARQGNYDGVSEAYEEAFRAKGYEPEIEMPLPLAQIKLFQPIRKRVLKYRRILDMERGEAQVRWEDGGAAFERRAFVSRARDIVVFRQTCDAAFDIELEAGVYGKNELGLVLEPQTRLQRDELRFTAKTKEGMPFGLTVLVETDGTVTAGERLSVKGCTRLMLRAKAFVGPAEHKVLPEEGYDALLDEHARLHSELFHRAYVRLGAEEGTSNEELLLEAADGSLTPELIDKAWAFGRYLFLCGTAPDSEPFALYGLWHGEYRAMWSYHTNNENMQMMYWQAPGGGLAEFIPGMFRYFESKAPEFEEMAQKMFGCKGYFVPGCSSYSTTILQIIHPIMIHWIGAGGWLCQHFFDYYRYTGDRAFLKDRLLPFMEKVAAFYLDYMTLDDNGKYQIVPSVSPENTPLSLKTRDGVMVNEYIAVRNALMDYAIIKELLNSLLEAYEALGCGNEQADIIREALGRIPEYMVNESGAVKEWLAPELTDNNNHRHLSHLYPVFPGREYAHRPELPLYRAFEKAVDDRKRVGVSDQMNWSFLHMACIYARLGRGNDAENCIRDAVNTCMLGNLLTVSVDWRHMGGTVEMDVCPVQLDANLGLTAAVQEMLLYNAPDLVCLLPAVPDSWKQGSFALDIMQGRCEVQFDQQRLMAAVTLREDSIFRLEVPERYGCGQTVSGKKGETIRLTFTK